MRIFSGIQPTGRKHLGNYLGAIRHWVAGQERGEGLYCLVDLHATTVAYQPADLQRYVLDSTAMLLAAGIDPSRSILYLQGDVVEHAELCWLLSSSATHGELERMHQFKDKSSKQELVSSALFLYPVLMAADILLYQTDEVPVGDDQRQHVELARNVAERFNHRFGPTFVVPEHRIAGQAARVMDLQAPEQKMSTTSSTEAGTIYVLDDEKAITKKFKSAVTDSGTEIRRAEDKPGISNMIEILSAIRGTSFEAVEEDFRGKMYGHLKVAVGEEVAAHLKPIRDKYPELRADEKKLHAILDDGAAKARTIAQATMAMVRTRMGVTRAPVSPTIARALELASAAQEHERKDKLDQALKAYEAIVALPAASPVEAESLRFARYFVEKAKARKAAQKS